MQIQHIHPAIKSLMAAVIVALEAVRHEAQTAVALRRLPCINAAQMDQLEEASRDLNNAIANDDETLQPALIDAAEVLHESGLRLPRRLKIKFLDGTPTKLLEYLKSRVGDGSRKVLLTRYAPCMALSFEAVARCGRHHVLSKIPGIHKVWTASIATAEVDQMYARF
jgi:hypothetical protein